MKNNFYENRKRCFARGEKAEQVIYKYLTEEKGFNVIDVTLNKKYQNIDTDFLLDFKNREFKIEVKTDFHISKYNSFLLEFDTYKDGKVYKGWMNKSQADYLIWYSFELEKVFVLDFYKLREWSNKHKLKRKYNKFEKCDFDCQIISIDECRKCNILREEIKYVA